MNVLDHTSERSKLCFFFTIIHKKILQLIDVGGSRVPGENPYVQVSDHHNLSHTTTVDQGDRTWVTAVISNYIVHCAIWTPWSV